MNNYPHLTHYQPLLDVIKDKPEFVARINEDLRIITIGYKVLAPGAFTGETEEQSALLRECRGIVFDLDSGEVISRRFHKFGNLNDSDENLIDNIDFSKRHWVMDKLDGSMVSFIKRKDRYYAMTKMGYTDFSTTCEHYAIKENFRNLIDDSIKNNWTAVFEFISPEKPIVIDYEQEDMILTAVRDNISGEYVLNPDQLKEYGERFGVGVVASYLSSNNIINEIDSMVAEKDIEGFIIRFENGDMKKCKTKFYIERHRATLGTALFEQKDITRMILDETIDDIMPFVTDEKLRKCVNQYREEFVNGLNKSISKVLDMYDDLYVDNKKEFVEKVNKSDIFRPIKSILLSNYEDKDNIEFAIKRQILKHTASRAKINEIKPLFDNVDYQPESMFRSKKSSFELS